MAEATKRYAVVTGGNKGIGFGICKQLASEGITVVLTARDPKKGLEAVEKLGSDIGVSGQVIFHQLDVADPTSVSSLANFIRINLGKLDILINNAGVPGAQIDKDALEASMPALAEGAAIDFSKVLTETYELAEECIRTNYYGPKEMCKALIPLLEVSDSPKIVNVCSTYGKLQYMPSGWPKGVLSDAESLTEEKLEEVVSQFLPDFKEGTLEAKGWPAGSSAYTVSKAALNAYTRILAKKYRSFCINSVCPGHVKTEFSQHTGPLTADEGAESAVRLALLPNGSHSGLFFSRSDVTSF
ncbi:(+)-neomenthol dehydrogenase-like [Prosopis cineraria]|uniref:(+)-neomenthol dehydrogenase-like n=1 Tax=Prosopis cineraria TaxID=364024 RepID=UPI00241016E7|nr:(+)-neomenthol dehydrogenase-like [Prosopis cineraria]